MTGSAPSIVLTGASSGIGAALAVELARQQQARIALVARRAEKLEEVAERVRAAGGEALVLPCDVSDAAAVAAAVQRAVEAFGTVDIAIANAGVGDPMPMRKIDAGAIHRVMRINFEGATNLFSAVVPGMLERGEGQVVGVSSIAGYRGLPGAAPYSASKAALSTFMEGMRLELKPLGIAVTVVHPGFVRSPMTDLNTFKMPFLVELDPAARIIASGIRNRRREINFPWAMVSVMRLVRLLPGWLFDGLLGRASPFAKPGGKLPKPD